MKENQQQKIDNNSEQKKIAKNTIQPIYIVDINIAQQNKKDDGLYFGEFKLEFCVVIGKLVLFEDQGVKTSLMIDDNTGQLEAVMYNRYDNPQIGFSKNFQFKKNMYVRAILMVRMFENLTLFVVTKIFQIIDFNEISFHMLRISMIKMKQYQKYKKQNEKLKSLKKISQQNQISFETESKENISSQFKSQTQVKQRQMSPISSNKLKLDTQKSYNQLSSQPSHGSDVDITSKIFKVIQDSKQSGISLQSLQNIFKYTESFELRSCLQQLLRNYNVYQTENEYYRSFD